MQKFLDRIITTFRPVKPLSPGFFHFQSSPENPLNYRMHLRIESDSTGLLIINASTVLHLNQTATEYAYHLISQTPFDEVAKSVGKRYNARFEDIQKDYSFFKGQIEALIVTPDLDPVTYLNMDRQQPYKDKISAPFRLDCAITYRVPANSRADSAPVKRVDRELTTAEWKTILTKAWQAGIPHIIFTGGEPTLREDLRELIARAEENGQVTGVLTDGIALGDTEYLQKILKAGLDHTLIILQPDMQESWDSLANFSYWSDTLKDDIFVGVHITITEDNHQSINSLIDKLADAGVHALSLSASASKFSPTLNSAKQYAYSKDMELIWDIPVPYSNINPIALELETNEEEKTLSGSGRGWLYIEPDGDVLPGQGINHILGNLLNDEWASIWDKANLYFEENSG